MGLLMGITSIKTDPVLVYSLPNGLGIYRSPFKDRDGCSLSLSLNGEAGSERRGKYGVKEGGRQGVKDGGSSQVGGKGDSSQLGWKDLKGAGQVGCKGLRT